MGMHVRNSFFNWVSGGGKTHASVGYIFCVWDLDWRGIQGELSSKHSRLEFSPLLTVTCSASVPAAETFPQRWTVTGKLSSPLSLPGYFLAWYFITGTEMEVGHSPSQDHGLCFFRGSSRQKITCPSANPQRATGLKAETQI